MLRYTPKEPRNWQSLDEEADREQFEFVSRRSKPALEEEVVKMLLLHE